jgi:hypothetical protein
MLNLIVVEKYDNTYFKLICNHEQSLELYSFFSCHIKNHYFHPKVKAKLWDGKISFFDMNNIEYKIRIQITALTL